MRRRVHQVRTAARLAIGLLSPRPGLRRTWAARTAATAAAAAVSFDVFDTLLFQEPGLDARVLDAICERIPLVLHQAGHAELPTTADLRAALARIRAQLQAPGDGRPARPEVPRREVYAALFSALGRGADSARLADELLRHELELRARLTSPNPEMLGLLETLRQQGLPLLAISDTALGRAEIGELLQRHGIRGIDRIYTSCEMAANKFHGELFSKVLAAEGLPPARLLHVGDNLWADVCAARWRGIPAIHYRAQLPKLPPAPTQDAAFVLGYSTLGPVLAAFAQLLLAQARACGWDRLAFVSRDGDLLREAVSRFVQAGPTGRPPQLSYVHFSRRATALPAARRVDAAALRAQQRIRAPGSLMDRVLDYHGIAKATLPADLAARLQGANAGAALGDARLMAWVDREAKEQTELLAAYLQQQGLAAATGLALVDVGWRGTIQAALNRTFAGDPSFRPLPAAYLGLWGGADDPPTAGAMSIGLLGDWRRGRHLLEAAPWHLALVLESVCRARHGTVLGYRRAADGGVQPVHAEQGPARRREQEQEAVTCRIREGILAAIDVCARLPMAAPRLQPGLRRQAQWRLLRLAFFPRRSELQVLATLVHTESHVSDWSPALVSPDRPSPWRTPRRWLAGLASPWRGGYVAATGGWGLSLVYFGIEAVLAACRPCSRRVEALARRLAGL